MPSQHKMPQELQFERIDLNNCEAVDRFNQAGCLQVANFLPPSIIRSLTEDLAAYRDAESSKISSVLVGEKRKMFPVPMAGSFGNREIYASSEFNAFLARTLGQSFQLNCFICVTSEPGAPKQHIHRDYEGLFGHAVDYFLPSFAINLFIPLVPLDGQSGTTRIWPYSHRKADFDTENPGDEFIDPQVPLGSALLMDYRVMHRGMDNHSSMERPVLCLAFSRDWFVDRRNFVHFNSLPIDGGIDKNEPKGEQALASDTSIDFAFKSD